MTSNSSCYDLKALAVQRSVAAQTGQLAALHAEAEDGFVEWNSGDFMVKLWDFDGF